MIPICLTGILLLALVPPCRAGSGDQYGGSGGNKSGTSYNTGSKSTSGGKTTYGSKNNLGSMGDFGSKISVDISKKVDEEVKKINEEVKKATQESKAAVNMQQINYGAGGNSYYVPDDAVTAEVRAAAAVVSGDINALDSKSAQEQAAQATIDARGDRPGQGNAKVTAASKSSLQQAVQEQKAILEGMEPKAARYLDAEEVYHKVKFKYFDPKLIDSVVGHLTSLKSNLALQQAILDGSVPKDQEQFLNDSKRPQDQLADPRDARTAANAVSGARERAAGGRGADGEMTEEEFSRLKASAGLVDVGAQSSAGSKRVDGRFDAPGKGTLDASALLAGKPLGVAAAGAEGARGAESFKQGEALLSSGKTLEALSWARKMVSDDPLNPLGHRLLAKALSRLGRYDEAEKAAEEAVRLGPNDPQNYLALAWAQLHLKKYQEALASVNKAIALDPNNAEAYALRAFIYEQMDEREKMLADLRKAAALDPEKYEELLRRALAGERVFDPNDPNGYMLLEGLTGGRKRVLPKVDPKNLGIGLAALALLAGGALGFRRRKESAVGAAPAAGPAGPAAAQAAFAEKYRLGRQLLKTERTEVLEAHDTSLDRDVLVRRLTFSPDESGARQRARAVRDIRLLADMRHPGIESVIEVAEIDDGLHVVLEHSPWLTAEALMKETGRMSLAQVKTIMARACDALSAAHKRGLLHRCVTPAKILVSGQGYVRLTDFGSWGGCDPAYRAPETEGGIEVPSTDVYALGATLYTLLVGHPPYEKDVSSQRSKREYKDPSACVPGLPAALDALVRDALSPASSARVQSVHAFRERLNQA